MYFERFITERNLQPETIKGYRSTIKKYTEYYDMTLDDLINEAIDEENNIVTLKSKKDAEASKTDYCNSEHICKQKPV